MQRGKWSDDCSEILQIDVPSVGVEPTLGGFERELLLLVPSRTFWLHGSDLLGGLSLDANYGRFRCGWNFTFRQNRRCGTRILCKLDADCWRRKSESAYVEIIESQR